VQKVLKEIKCPICKRDYFKSLVDGWSQFGFVFRNNGKFVFKIY
jgi:hypothetical protein